MDESENRVNTTERSFRILELIKEENGLPLDEITEQLDLAKSTAHRHVETLVTHGYLIKKSGQYRIGIRFLDPAIHARNNRSVFQTATSHVDELADKIGEDVWLLAMESGHSIVLYRADISGSIKTSERLGQRRLLHQSAGGKAMLAELPDSEVLKIVENYGLEPLTEDTITKKATLFEELTEIRDRGYGCNFQETVIGLNAASTAITGPEGNVEGAISVTGPERRLHEELIHEEIADKLLARANEIEVNLRYS